MLIRRLIQAAAGIVVAGVILGVIFVILIYNAVTRTYTQPPHVDISKIEWRINGDTATLPLIIHDDYWNYEEDIAKKITDFESAHPDWCIARKWIPYRDRSFLTEPVIGGVELERAPVTPSPARTTETTTTTTTQRTTRVAKK